MNSPQRDLETDIIALCYVHLGLKPYFRVKDAGVRVEWIPLESLIDGYGAAHCMTQVLQREVADR